MWEVLEWEKVGASFVRTHHNNLDEKSYVVIFEIDETKERYSKDIWWMKGRPEFSNWSYGLKEDRSSQCKLRSWWCLRLWAFALRKILVLILQNEDVRRKSWSEKKVSKSTLDIMCVCIYTDCFLCHELCKNFKFVITLNPSEWSPEVDETIIHSLHKWGDWGIQCLNNMPRVKQIGCGQCGYLLRQSWPQRF